MLTFSEKYIEYMLNDQISDDHRQVESQEAQLLRQLIEERPKLLAYLTYYRVPDYVVTAICRRIFRFVLARAAYVPGDWQEKAQQLVNGYYVEDPWVIYLLLYSYQVSHGVILYFIRSVVDFTLEHIASIPTPPELGE